MRQDDLAFSIQVKLSIQRAMWDCVTPGLRGVAVKLSFSLISARFIYEDLGDEELEMVGLVGSYVAAAFLPPVEVDSTGIEIRGPGERLLEPDEFWVYLRYEAPLSS